MRKAVVASLLAIASAGSSARFGFSQAPAAAPAASGQVQMPQAEYNDYTAAIGQTTPQTKAPALEAYLTKYPNSSVKADVLQQLMVAYSSFDPTKTLDAADRLLQVQPDNLRAITLEVYFRKSAADQLTDPSAKQTALDKAADYAQKGLAAAKPTEMSDADFTTLKTNAYPIFYSAIGTAALNKKDTATAIDNFKKELAAVPVDQTTKPGPILQDTYYLGLAYLQSTPPDLLDCSFYVARFIAFAPDPYKTQMAPTAQYCYKKYHGNADGYDKITTAASANLNPPSDLFSSITPAPKPADIAHQTVTSTPDLGTLALSDKEFILQNGSQEDADKVWDTVKGKTVQIPGATVISATDSVLTVAVSDDAVQSKQADFTFNMKEPLKTVPTVGAKIDLTGTYASYTRGSSTPAASTTPAATTGTTAAPSSTGTTDATGTAATTTGTADAAGSTAAGSAPGTTTSPATAGTTTVPGTTAGTTGSTTTVPGTTAGTTGSTTTGTEGAATQSGTTSGSTDSASAAAAPGQLMIVMSDGTVVTKEAPRRTTTRRPAARRRK